MKNRARYKKTGIIAIVLIAVLIVTVFIRFRMQSTTAGNNEDKQASSDAAMTINRFEHTATRDGRKEWILKAASAQIYSDQNRVALSDIEMTLFASDETEVKLTAENGEFETQSRNISVHGSVTARYPGYVLRTESLHYQHELHILYSKQKVIITGESIRISADSAKLELTTDQIILEGNVQAWMDPIEQK